MKKFFAFLFCAVLTVAAALGLSACGEDKDEIHVYAPDGAPALALAYAMSVDDERQFGKDVDYEIVDAKTVQTYVTGRSPRADICILPVNVACNLLGMGETYQLLGTVTHGNLYILKSGSAEDIASVDDLAKLKGKKVGIVNRQNVPGLTFKTILKENDIEFDNYIANGATPSDKVLLADISDGPLVSPQLGYDYYVVPEPAATAKSKAFTQFAFTTANLQSLYGGEKGYPQAVVVAKKSLIEKDLGFILKFIETLIEGRTWLESAYPAYVAGVINDELTKGMKPSLNANNLTSEVIEHCAVKFEDGASCKQSIIDYMTKINQVGSQFNLPQDEFFFSVA